MEGRGCLFADAHFSFHSTEGDVSYCLVLMPEKSPDVEAICFCPVRIKRNMPVDMFPDNHTRSHKFS